MAKKKLPMGQRVYSLGPKSGNIIDLTPSALAIIMLLRKGPMTRDELMPQLQRVLKNLGIKQPPESVFAWWKKKLIDRRILKVKVA